MCHETEHGVLVCCRYDTLNALLCDSSSFATRGRPGGGGGGGGDSPADDDFSAC